MPEARLRGDDELAKPCALRTGQMHRLAHIARRSFKATSLDPRLRGDDERAKPCPLRTGQMHRLAHIARR
ncbi:MAG: hypothetical protein ABWY01_03555, partial [Pseudoxanthomonas sp.]